MERAGETPSPKSPTRASASWRSGRLLVKVAAWTLAVPMLGAAVIAGGAVPLYLLLPDAKPASASTPASPVKTAAAKPAPLAPARAAAKRADAAPAEAVAEVGDAPAEDLAPAPDPVEVAAVPSAPAKAAAVPVKPADAPVIVAAVPTPRPVLPAPQARPPAKPAPLADGKAIPPEPAGMADVGRAVASRADAGRPVVIRTAAKLRDAPEGAEIGVLPQGAAARVVGRCGRWCEVSVAGRRGFVHASLIDDGTRRSAARRIPPRFPDERPAEDWRDAERYDDGGRYVGGRGMREAAERRAARRYAEERYAEERWLAERRAAERAYRRGDWLMEERELPPEEPGWLLEDDRRSGSAPMLLYADPYR